MPDKLYAHPQGHVFYRKMAHARSRIDHGEGVYLYDGRGRRYLDASGGAIVVSVGHGRAEVVEAMARQAKDAAYIHASMFTSEAIERYCERLAAVVPLPGARFFFLSSGSEMVEAAMKLARQIQLARGEVSRHVIISRTQSYHGMTLGALAASGRQHQRRPYLDMMVPRPHVAPPYPYRDPRSGLEMAALVEAAILAEGPGRVAAFLAEPISGASLGAVAPDDDYWPAVRAICDRYGVLLIADEVLVGMGRTGKMWGLEHWGVVPDLLVSSKGLASGYFPLGFVAAKGEDIELLRRRLGDFNHGGTFSHHAVGAAAGLAVLEIIEREGLVERSAVMGERLLDKLRQRLGDHPNVGDIRGRGLFAGVELVADRATKEPFDASLHLASAVYEAAFERGLILYYSLGCVDSERGDVMLFGPPFIVSDEHLDEMVEGLAAALDLTLEKLTSGVRHRLTT